jgi:hypothetical protein
MNDATMLLVHGLALHHLTPFLDGRPWNDSKRDLLLALRPDDADFARVFLPSLEPQARTLYAQLWHNPPPLLAKPGQTELRVNVALPEDFAAWNERGQEFPGGYRKLAPHLQPDVPWVAWKLLVPGDRAGLSFDGIVWTNQRLVWFPQPWRLIPMGQTS